MFRFRHRPVRSARSFERTGRRASYAAAVALLAALAPAQQPSTPEQLAGPPPPLSGAIYFDAWQLEKEITASPLVLQEWIDLGLREDSTLDPAQRDALKPRIGEFLGKRCPVLIGGEEIDFTLDRIHFIEPDQQEFAIIDEEATVRVKDVQVTAVFAAPNTDPDLPLQVLWNLFPEAAAQVPVRVADVVGSSVFNVSRGTPTVSVIGRYEAEAREVPEPPPAPAHATIELPWLTILLILAAVPVLVRLGRSKRGRVVPLVLLMALAGAAAAARNAFVLTFAHPFDKSCAPDADQAAVVLDRLLRQVYHAFDFRDDSQQYDVLAKAVGGEALTDIFLEVRRTLESRQRDGARVRVHDLTVEAATPTPLGGRRGFEAKCTWEVRGRVGHWGHFHDRTNRYEATFTIEPLDNAWKITGLTLHSRDREGEHAR